MNRRPFWGHYLRYMTTKTKERERILMLHSSAPTIPSVFGWAVRFPQTSLQVIGWLTLATYVHIHIYMHVFGLWHGARAPGENAGGYGEGFEPKLLVVR